MPSLYVMCVVFASLNVCVCVYVCVCMLHTVYKHMMQTVQVLCVWVGVGGCEEFVDGWQLHLILSMIHTHTYIYAYIYTHTHTHTCPLYTSDAADDHRGREGRGGQEDKKKKREKKR